MRYLAYFIASLLCTLVSCITDSSLIPVSNPALELRTDGGTLNVTATLTDNQTATFTAAHFELTYVNASTIYLEVDPGTDGAQSLNVSSVSITANNSSMNLSCTQGQNQTLYEGVSHLTAQPGSGTIQLNLDHGNIITTSSNVVGDEMGGI